MKLLYKVFGIDFLSKVLTAIITIMLIRKMSSTTYANYAIITSVVNLFSQIAVTSFTRFYIIEYENIKKMKFELFVIEIIFSIFVGIIFYLFQSNVKLFFYETIFLLIATSIFGYVRGVFQQLTNFKIYSLIEIIRVISFGIFILFITLFYSNFNIQIIVILQGLSLFFSLFFLIYKYPSKSFKRKFDFKLLLKKMFERQQINLFIYAILTAVLLQMDIFMLRKFSDDYAVASYAAATRYYGIMLMVLSTVNSILLPTVANLKDYLEIKRIFKEQDKLVYLFFIISFLGVVISPFMLPILDGGKYPNSIKVFQILCGSIFISFLGSPYNNILIKERKYRTISFRLLVAIFISIVGNYFLVPKYREIGTAISTLLSFGIVNLSARIHGKMIIKKKIEEYNE